MKVRSVGLALIAGVVLLGGTDAGAQAPAAGQRIGYIDLSRVLARSAAGVAAREQLEREKAGMQKEMDAKRVELDKLREELEKKGPLMTADARRDKEEMMERKRRDATRLADDFQRELGRKEQVLAQKVMQDISGVIEKVGRKIVRDVENLFENVATSLEAFDFFLVVRRVSGKAGQAGHAERLNHVFRSHNTSQTVARIAE